MVGARNIAWPPEVGFSSADAFLCHEVGIGAAQSRGTRATVIVDHHLVFSTQLQEVLHAYHGLVRIILPEVYLDALDAPVGPLLEGLLHIVIGEVLAIAELGSLPQQALHALFLGMLHQRGHPLGTPSAIDERIGPAHLGSEVGMVILALPDASIHLLDVGLVAIRAAPVPCRYAWLYPRHVVYHSGRAKILGHSGLEDCCQVASHHHAPRGVGRQRADYALLLVLGIVLDLSRPGK